MKKWIATAAAAGMLICAGGAFAKMEGHSGHGSPASAAAPGTYEHSATVEGIRTEFQIMSLASMNMKDPNGATHHVMLRLFDDKMDHPVDGIVGKIKIIAPSGAEQVSPLSDYNGVYAANFTFTEKGKYGVICLFKRTDQKHMVKFWYPHS